MIWVALVLMISGPLITVSSSKVPNHIADIVAGLGIAMLICGFFVFLITIVQLA